MAQETKPTLRILRRKQLEDRTGLSRSTIYERINPNSTTFDPDFPKPIKLGTGMRNPPVGWIESEVDAWVTRQMAQSRHTGGCGTQKTTKEIDLLNEVFLFAKGGRNK